MMYYCPTVKLFFAGNVEILHFGKWGAVCDDEWGAEEAKVVCRQLGLGPSLRHSHSAKYGLAKSKNYYIFI